MKVPDLSHADSKTTSSIFSPSQIVPREHLTGTPMASP